MAPCISVSSLNCILKAIGSQCNRFSAAVMLCWSRRRKPRTTLAAARWTISSLCSNDPLIPQRAALPKSSLDVTSACTSVLRALTVRDDRIRLMHRSCAYAVRHLRLTCAAMDIAESSCTPRSRMLVDAMMLHPHTSMQSGGGCGMRLFGAVRQTDLLALLYRRQSADRRARLPVDHTWHAEEGSPSDAHTSSGNWHNCGDLPQRNTAASR